MAERKKPTSLYLAKVKASDRALQLFDGDKEKAAKFLGISKRGLMHRISGNEYLNRRYNTRRKIEDSALVDDLLRMLRKKKDIKESLYYRCLTNEEKEIAGQVMQDFENELLK